MLSENGVVIKIDTTGRQTTRPRVSKMADRRYHVAKQLRFRLKRISVVGALKNPVPFLCKTLLIVCSFA